MTAFRFFVLLSIVLVNKLSVSQQFILLSATDSAAVSYANITFYINDSLLNGTYSNSKGHFFVSDTNTEKFSISHVSYRDTVVNFNPQKVPEKLFLSPQNISLKTVTISDDQTENSNTVYLGIKLPKRKILFWEKNDNRNSATMLINCDTSFKRPQRILRLQPGHKGGEKFIKSFVFYSDVRHKGTNYIVKVLFYENKEGAPGKRLPHEIVKELTPEDEGRIDVKVSQHGVMLPPEGLFIGLEFVGCSEYIEVPEPSKLAQKMKSYSFGAIRDYLFINEVLNSPEKIFIINIDEKGVEHRVQRRAHDEYGLAVPVFGLEVYE